MGQLEGKIAVVTGVGRPLGIGRSCALKLAEMGADVMISDLCRKYEGDLESYNLGQWEQLEKVAGEIEAKGRKARAFKVDVTIRSEIEDMVGAVVKEFGHIDVLINNAGTGVGVGPFLNISEAAWDKTIDVNLKGIFHCCQLIIPHMIEAGGGKIVNIASGAGLRGAALYGAYTASKFAAVGISQVLGAEFAPFGINVNAVCPAIVDTDMGFDQYEFLSFMKGTSIDEVREGLNKQIPLGRAATADDVAETVGFLVSPAAEYIVGQAIRVSGGKELT
jgi:NAD(P)-dependent dehydrogenase (short-subunit alcohol dehydrogenase family)